MKKLIYTDYNYMTILHAQTSCLAEGNRRH